jgi:hypothetical protein
MYLNKENKMSEYKTLRKIYTTWSGIKFYVEGKEYTAEEAMKCWSEGYLDRPARINDSRVEYLGTDGKWVRTLHSTKLISGKERVDLAERLPDMMVKLDPGAVNLTSEMKELQKELMKSLATTG